MNRIWITWEYQIRNSSMARELNAQLFEIVEEGSRAPRYLKSIHKTLSIISKHKPKVVFHQNPSIVLGLLLILARPFFKYKLVTDTHNAGLFPAEGKHPFLNWIGRKITSVTDVAIVHNESIAETAKPLQDNLFIIPDPLPELSTTIDINSPASKNDTVVFVCRWSADEPYEAVIDAANQLIDQDVKIIITGKAPETIKNSDLPENIELSGFLSKEEYQTLILTADVLVVLTTRSNSLNCGGYEALAAGKPCILSNTQTLKDFFGDSFLYTDNSPADIANQIRLALETKHDLASATAQKRQRYLSEYQSYINGLNLQVESFYK